MKVKISSSKLIIFMVLAFIVVSVTLIVYAEEIEPGSEGDPLVTKSYVDEQISKIESSNTQSAKVKYSVLELEKNSKIIGEEGTELILRTGTAEAISGNEGDGLADLTTDEKSDYFTGQQIPENHILLVSRTDERGILITSEKAFVVIRGEYTLIK